MSEAGPTLYQRLGGHEGIRKLIEPFYADVRQHNVLGPIFNAHIPNWDVHLAKITDFWALQTGGPSFYRGGFGAAHLRLGLKVAHFQYWLGLWEFNCRRQLGPGEAEEMIARAHQLGNRLYSMTAGRAAG